MSADPIHDVMPFVSRALKRGDRRGATRELERVLPARVARLAVESLTGVASRPGYAPRHAVLTPAEWAAVWNAACGLTVAEVATRFMRTPNTVRSHRKQALRRLRVTSMAGAVAECYRRDIFSRHDPLVPVDW